MSIHPKEKYLLEFCEKSGTTDRRALFTYRPDQKKWSEIGADLFITPYVEIQNAVWESEDFYFPVLASSDGNTQQVDIYKFAAQTRTWDIIYSFTEDTKLSARNRRSKVFVLSETILFIQNETLDFSRREKRMGNIRFEQMIVDLESGEEIPVKDENLKNNGLNRIIPVSPVQVLTKTGYSYIEDDRFGTRSEDAALIESVFIHTTSRFIVDLLLGATTIDAFLLDSTYYSQYILTPRFRDDYVYYLIVNPDEGSSVSHFYHVISSEQLTCKNEMLDMDDLNINYVLAGHPYVKNTALLETRFLNLHTMEFDLSAMDRDFSDIIGKLLILKKTGRREESILEFYHYPEMKLVYKEKGTSVTGCANKDEDEYYICIHP